MPYKRCVQYKKRLSNNSINLFCDNICDSTYTNSSEISCKFCNKILGKQSVIKNKIFCNNICHNLYQKKINLEKRKCVFCNKNFIVSKSSNRHKLCSTECETLYIKSNERNDKRMNTLIQNNLEKYGVENIFSLKEIQEKSKKTRLEKYGHEYFNNNEIAKQTKLKKYGTLDFSDKAKQTKLKKYGTLNVNDKSKQTKLNKYGTLDFSKKANETKIKKYGTCNFTDKTRKTTIEKYGSYSKILLKKAFKRLEKKFSSVVKFLFSEEEYVGVNKYKKYQFECLKCSSVFTDDMCNGSSPVCRICNPIMSNISNEEKEILSYIKTIYDGEIIENDRNTLNGQEIDILVHHLNLGIECDGIYWHSELAGGKDKHYHLHKTKLSLDKNIQLMHIWDWEWRCKQDIIKSILLSKIGKSKRIFARKCEIKQVINDEKSAFLIDNHIQGNDASSIRLGLYHNDVLVSLMTFVKSRYDKKYQYELSRYCNILNANVIGGASKLFNYFIKNYDVNSIVTYSDRRLFTGNLYKQIGMSFVDNTHSGYHYFHKNKGVPIERSHFQKHKLKEKLEKFDINLSEWQNMQINGYDRIWDCGHMKFEWNRK